MKSPEEMGLSLARLEALEKVAKAAKEHSRHCERENGKDNSAIFIFSLKELKNRIADLEKAEAEGK